MQLTKWFDPKMTTFLFFFSLLLFIFLARIGTNDHNDKSNRKKRVDFLNSVLLPHLVASLKGFLVQRKAPYLQ